MSAPPNLIPSIAVGPPDHTTVPVNDHHQPGRNLAPMAGAEQTVADRIVKLPLNALDRDYFVGRDFTHKGIMQAYGLTVKQYLRIRRTLARRKLSDILFNYVDGPYYDTFINMTITGA